MLKNELYEDLTKLREDVQYQLKLLSQSHIDQSNKEAMRYEQLSSDMVKLNEQHRALSQEQEKQSFDSQQQYKSFIQAQKTGEMEMRLLEEIDKVQKTVDEISLKKIDKKEYVEMKAKIVQAIEEKVDLKEV